MRRSNNAPVRICCSEANRGRKRGPDQSVRTARSRRRWRDHARCAPKPRICNDFVAFPAGALGQEGWLYSATKRVTILAGVGREKLVGGRPRHGTKNQQLPKLPTVATCQ